MTQPTSAVPLLLRMVDGITRAGYGAALLILAFMALAFCYEVGSRYFFSAPTRWISDYAAYGLCVTVFLTVPEISRARAHVAITFLVDGLSARRARTLRRLIALVATVACLFAAWISADENIRQFAAGEETVATIPIPRWWISIFITYGFLGAGIHFLRQVFSPDPPEAGA
jgi:C4-dicarboxylate transporter, DctQ subunit